MRNLRRQRNCLPAPSFLNGLQLQLHTHTHMYIYIQMYTNMYVCSYKLKAAVPRIIQSSMQICICETNLLNSKTLSGTPVPFHSSLLLPIAMRQQLRVRESRRRGRKSCGC